MATKAPKVQSLSQAVAALNPAYSGQLSLINKQKAGLGAKYDAQRSGLIAEKGEGFNAINDQATGRGGSFSGIPQHEQARYLSTKFLPGMQMADFQQNEEGIGFQKEAAALKAEQRMQAMGRIDSQKKDLFSWNMQMQSQQAQAREAEKQRQFQASQAAADRSFSASQKAAEDTGPSVNQYLQDAFGSYYSGENVKNGWTENVLAGNLASAYGMSRKDALKVAYKYRKQYYGN